MAPTAAINLEQAELPASTFLVNSETDAPWSLDILDFLSSLVASLLLICGVVPQSYLQLYPDTAVTMPGVRKYTFAC
jgi:hypothetical protein